ncbi:MAG: hypothetical protein IKK62_12915 [Bacteroidaceae bacterium]|nr:hypothetical protein [Bacteroidaceae bacterium]
MKKTLRKLFAFALVMLFAMNVDAGKKVLLSANFDDGSSPMGGWGNNHTREVVEGALKITNPSAVQSWEAQMAYDFGTPFLPNNEYTLTMKVRGSAAGQISIGLQNADNNYASVGEFGTVDFDVDWMDVRLKCMCNGEGGKRFIFSFGQFEGDIYIDDLELSVYEEGESGGNSGADPNLRWINILTNSDLEGEENISFVSVENNPEKVDETGAYIRGNSEITDGIGVDGSRGIKVSSFAGAAQNWDAQFWIVLPEPFAAGTEYRVKFDYRASMDVTTETQAHSTPSNYLHYEMIGNPAFTTEWQSYERTGTLTDAQSGGGTFQSIAFNLAINRESDVDFFFDNLTFEVLSKAIVPQYSGQVILMDMGRKTNISELVAVTGKRRLVYPAECATVKVEGEEISIASIEAFADGRFYIFVDDLLDEDSEVEVNFINPINPSYRLVYRDGDFEDVADYNGVAFFNPNVEVDDAIPVEFAAPEVMTINPENGSFNLPVTFNEFKIVFDKAVSCKDLSAWFAGEKLTVTPAEGYAEEVTLTRKSTADLAEGAYELELSDIHADNAIEESFWGSATYTINIGHNLADFEEAVDLMKMIETAKGKRDANVDAIYEGQAYTDLCTMIDKYEAEYASYTAPSVFRSATKTLNAAIVDMDAHHNLVDTYYSTVDNASGVVAGYSESKFASLPLFIELKEALAKYVNEEGSAIKLIADEELQAAIDALKATSDNAGKLFTEGPSSVTNTGIKVLVERLRLGAEVLQKLGVAASDQLIVDAYNAMSDDDNLADQLKNRVKVELYGKLKDPNNTLFAEKVDETTLETVTETYDMTVFFKNPNIYKQLESTNYSPENVPGWTTPEGQPAPGISWGWDAAPGHTYTDCMFQTWGSSYVTEQTVVDLPAGVYTIKAGFGERMGEDEDPNALQDSYFYVKTSQTAEGEVADSVTAPRIGQSFPSLNIQVQNIVVADGMLTIGVHGGPSSHTFFNDIQVLMANIAPGVNYADLYTEAVEGIEGTVAAPAQVMGIELYDLNGRRIMKAQQGVVIMKKFMNDGTIRVEKVIKK